MQFNIDGELNSSQARKALKLPKECFPEQMSTMIDRVVLEL